MATASEARNARKHLRRHSRRIQTLIERSMSQVCDGDLRMVDRETAEQRLLLLFREQQVTAEQLERVETALER